MTLQSYHLAEIIQRPVELSQNKLNSPLFHRNNSLYRDLKIPALEEEIKRYFAKHEGRLHFHVNEEALQFLDKSTLNRRL